MFNEEKMYAALRRFDWKAVVVLLPQPTPEVTQALLTAVLRSGCLIRVHEIGAKKDAVRVSFIEEITKYAGDYGGESALKFVEYLLQQVEFTELGLAEIRRSLRSDGFYRLPPSAQAWAALQWAAKEILDVFDQLNMELAKQVEGNAVVIDPLRLRLNKEHGQGLASGRVGQIAQTLANTLRMLAHENDWFVDGNLDLPAKQEVTNTEIDSTARIARLGDVWDDLLEESRYHRYWGGHFEVRLPTSEQRDLMPDLTAVLVSATSEFERRDHILVYEHIAHIRFERISHAAAAHIRATDAIDKIGDPRKVNVALPPKQLISELELAFLFVLDRHFYFDPRNDLTEFGGLRILEWLRGYEVLRSCYTSDPDGGLLSLVELDPIELEQTLVRAGLTSEKAVQFINRVTFRPGRRDFYDAPILRSIDGKLFFFAALYHGVDIPRVIASQIGSQKMNVDKKGMAFEKAIVLLFEEAGIPARSFKFKIGQVEYQCDVAVLWDDVLFIFECKNYGLPNNDPSDRRFFWDKEMEAVQQVERIAEDLVANPEILRTQFGPEASWTKVCRVVLNALPLSILPTAHGTYIYDGSALHRFLRDGTLNVIQSSPPSQGGTIISIPIKQLWSGETPTAADLIRELESPSQAKMHLDEYYIARRLLRLSSTSALSYMRAASKPPDFEPLEPEGPQNEERFDKK